VSKNNRTALEKNISGGASESIDSPGLPDDGISAYQKSQYGNILEGSEMENVGIFYAT
jgi:hypothetical protein